jgi:hypothetical protein
MVSGIAFGQIPVLFQFSIAQQFQRVLRLWHAPSLRSVRCQPVNANIVITDHGGTENSSSNWALPLVILRPANTLRVAGLR